MTEVLTGPHRRIVLGVATTHGRSMICALARLGGLTLCLSRQPPTTWRRSSRQPCRRLAVVVQVPLPVIFLADNPGVMPGPEAERIGTRRAAAWRCTRRSAVIKAAKIHVTIRKHGSVQLADGNESVRSAATATIAFPGISLGGVPQAAAPMRHTPCPRNGPASTLSSRAHDLIADNGSYDRVIDPRDLRTEIIRALVLPASDGKRASIGDGHTGAAADFDPRRTPDALIHLLRVLR